MALSEKAVMELANKNQIDPEQIRTVLSKEISGNVSEDDLLRIPFRIGTTLNRSMCHASRFFREVRDNGIFYAARCPVCRHVLFPPIRPVCLRCIKKGNLVEYEYWKLGNKVEGTVVAWSKLVRGTTKHIGQGELYPALIKVDQADNAHWQFVLPSENKKIDMGVRVRSCLLKQEDRTGEIGDYAFELITDY